MEERQRFLIEVSIHRSPERGNGTVVGVLLLLRLPIIPFLRRMASGDYEAKNEDDNNRNIWDFFEKEERRQHYTSDRVWYWLNSRSGNPFPDQEME